MADEQMETTLNSNDSENNCVLCCKDIEIYSIGACNHPICYECSTRLRVFFKNNQCPMCRQGMQYVYFSKSVRTYEELVKSYKKEYLSDDAHGIYFSSPLIKGRVDFLFSRKCNICKGVPWKYKTNEKLKQHLMREHGLSHCHVCVEHLKLFTFERKCYTESELARHNREGDPDDTSYRGHPVCKFCSTYFFDKDDLYIHLRRDHYRCHFCYGNKGREPFYSTRAHLYEHFDKDHYLCKKGKCKTDQLVSVFRTKAEYNNHLVTMHLNRLETIKERIKTNQRFQTVSWREYDGPIPSTSSTSSISSSLEGVSEELPMKNARSKVYHVPRLSQESRDNFFRQFQSASIPIGTCAPVKRKSKMQPSATTNQIVPKESQAGVSSGSKQARQGCSGQSYPPLKASQNSRGDFFKKFESNSAPQLSSSSGRIKKAQRESKAASSTSNNKQSAVCPPLQNSNTSLEQKEGEYSKVVEPRSKSYKLPKLTQKSREHFFRKFKSAQPVPEVEAAQTNYSIGILPFHSKEMKVEPSKAPRVVTSDVTGSWIKMPQPKKQTFQRPQLSQSSRESFFKQFTGVAPAQPASKPAGQSAASAKKDSDVGTSTKGKNKKAQKWTKLQ